MAEDVSEIFALVVEGHNQPPILLEAEHYETSERAAWDRFSRIVGEGKRYFRGAVVRLVFEGGNPLVLHGMRDLQDSPESLPPFVRRQIENEKRCAEEQEKRRYAELGGMSGVSADCVSGPGKNRHAGYRES